MHRTPGESRMIIRTQRIESFRVHNLNHFWFNALPRDFHTNSSIAQWYLRNRSMRCQSIPQFSFRMNRIGFGIVVSAIVLCGWIRQSNGQENGWNIFMRSRTRTNWIECVSYYNPTGTLLIKIDLLSGVGRLQIILEYVQRWKKKNETQMEPTTRKNNTSNATIGWFRCLSPYSTSMATALCKMPSVRKKGERIRKLILKIGDNDCYSLIWMRQYSNSSV